MPEAAVSFSPTDQMSMVQQMARDFAEKEIKPNVMKYDESQEFPKGIFAKMAELGFLGAYYPEEFGGAALSLLDFTVIIEEIAKVDPSVALGLCAHNGLCVSHIYNFASEALKKKYLPDLCSGKKLGGWGLTEAFSGSDAGGMRTVAVKEGNEWVINGTKNFITHAISGDTFVVLAVTDKTKNKSISAFIVEKVTEATVFTGLGRFAGEVALNELMMRSALCSKAMGTVILPPRVSYWMRSLWSSPAT